jgi:hypothetical protein
MCQRNRLVLTQCWRSDTVLFNFYGSLIPGGSRVERPLSEVVAEAREKFRFDGPADHNLVISHRKRVALNTELNELHRPGVAIRVEPKHKKPGALTQPMWLWPGIRLLGAATEGDKVKNQVWYEVAEVSTDPGHLVRFACGLALPAEKVADLFVLSYAQTYASCQGTEFDGTLRLHDTAHKLFTKRHLFVGLSRAKSCFAVDMAE